MKKIHNLYVTALLAGVFTAFAALAAPPAGYYNSLEGKSGVELKKATKELTKRHATVDYGDETWQAFTLSDTRDFNGAQIWWDMYSNDRIKVAFGHASLNIEHAVANSWWGGVRNDAYKDLFHLNPSNSTANNQKGNYPLGEIQSVTWTNDVTSVGTPKSGLGGGSPRVFEPLDYYKGDFARAFFYIFTTYDYIDWKDDTAWMYDTSSDLLLQPWAYNMLLEWAEKDPVSQKEYDRNEVIYNIQNNRNPFIDCPQLASHIWGVDNGKGFKYAGDFTPAPNPDLGDENYDDTPTLSGIWKAVIAPEELKPDGTYCILETGNFFAMSYKAETKNKYMAQCDIVPQVDVNKKHWTITAAPEDLAFVTLEPVAGGYALKISDVDGKSYGYLKSTASKSVVLGSDPNEAGCTATIDPSEEKTSISFGQSVGTLQYNKQSPRFNTYTSKQQGIMLFRLLGEDETDDEEDINKTPDQSGIDAIEAANTLKSIFKIYDINGRLMNTTDIDALGRGLYIVVTPAGNFKIAK